MKLQLLNFLKNVDLYLFDAKEFSFHKGYISQINRSTMTGYIYLSAIIFVENKGDTTITNLPIYFKKFHNKHSLKFLFSTMYQIENYNNTRVYPKSLHIFYTRSKYIDFCKKQINDIENNFNDFIEKENINV